MSEVIAIGDVLDEHDPEPPVGTTVILLAEDDERWQRLDTDSAWCWSGEHHGYLKPCWRWGRVTFTGPVMVVGVADV